MKDYTKVLTLEELLVQGAFQSIEKKWRRVKRTLNNMQHERLEDHQGFYYGESDNNESAFDDEIDESALYKSETLGGVGEKFTGFMYELYSSGELKNYTYYENGEMMASHSFHKNGSLTRYSRLGLGHIEFDEQGNISGQFGKLTKGYKGKEADEEKANIVKRFGTFDRHDQDRLLKNVGQQQSAKKPITPNPYIDYDEDSLKEEYFSLANHKLPELIASGFVRAIEQYKKKYINECSEIHCNVDIEKPALVFTFGDDSEDDRDCFIYRCGKTIIKCAEMAEAISTLVVGQECCHWLTAALAIAEKQGVFEGINIEISGSYMNDYDMDVIFSSM